MCVLDIDVKYIMVDDGSGECIIHPQVLTQMRLKSKIVPQYITLAGLIMNLSEHMGNCTSHLGLQPNAGDDIPYHGPGYHVQCHSRMTMDTSHEGLPSNLYHVIKFLTHWGIFSIQGEWRTSRECYHITFGSTTIQQKKTRKKRHINQ